MVLSGKRVSEGLRAGKGIIPVLTIKIIEAGEKTGSLDKSLKEISEYMDYQVSRTLDTLTSLLEPIMLIFIGLVVGGMMLSIIGPIYGLISQIAVR
jgi:type II secretory pathway component PulF